MANKVRSIKREQAKAEAKEAEITTMLADLFHSQLALRTLGQQPMPSRLAFKLVKTIKAVTAEMVATEETRIKLLDQYGKKNEKTGDYRLTKPNEEKFVSEFNDFLKTTEVTIKGEKVDIEGLPGLVISATDVMLLSWLWE